MTLEAHVAELAAKQDATNVILADILSALNGGTPVASEAKADPAPKKTKAKAKKPEIVPDETDAKIDDPAPEPIDIQDVQNALITFSQSHGKPETLRVLSQYTGNGNPVILKSIPADRYADLMAYIAELNARKEAA